MTAAPRATVPSVNAWNAVYMEEQYARYQADPAGVPDDLRSFFQGFDLARSGERGKRVAGALSGDVPETLRFQRAVSDLLDTYRRRGHMCAELDPFGRERSHPASLTLEYHELTEADLDRPANTGTTPLAATSSLRETIAFLERTYCSTIGYEIMHLSNEEERDWLIERIEKGGGRVPLTRGERAHVLEQLVRADQFEKFLGKRYPTQKRFSLEGSESLIALLDRAIEAAGNLGVEEIVLGMPHRGRLTTLNTIMGKTYEQIFTEFEDNWVPGFADAGGDVKYHRGYSGARQLKNGKSVHLAMSSNPSHLEAVDGVVLGRTRAKQRLRNDKARLKVMPMLLHGDAAVIGQGMVAEALQLSQLEGYRVGGCVHVVVNNLVGFTTGPEDARTSRYCTDWALAIESPVFHVNGEDPEAVVAAAQFAAEYRQKFQKDVFIDLWCFRRYGHNETDEASFTQPILAELIRQKKGVLEGYSQRLLAEGVINEADLQAIRDRLIALLERAQEAVKQKPVGPTIDPGSQRWEGFERVFSFAPVATAVSRDMIADVAGGLGRVPEGFNLNQKLRRLLDDRGGLMTAKEISYADAESLAFGTLLLEGNAVRLSGQDCQRGTFSHRHAVLRDTKTGEAYVPLNNMRPIAETPDQADGKTNQSRFCVYNSPLSEAAVMAFDYGYSLADPRMLVCWEAQFGDFANGAQVIIDQFLASSQYKWDRWSGLTLLLPHGYEGAGPEHSSARLERFLELCGNDNMLVVYPSTAAQCFHMLRRQVRANYRRPLIVMTPKSMLRVGTSTIDELSRGGFQEIIDDPRFSGAGGADPKGVKRVAICTGKLFHELAARRRDNARADTALVRIEQLYPFHTARLAEVLGRYSNRTELLWAQEEPRNMGAYRFVADRLRSELNLEAAYIGRETSASPAVGSHSRDRREQESIIARVMGESSKVVGGNGAHGQSNGHGNGVADKGTTTAAGAAKQGTSAPAGKPAKKPAKA
ncbi:MAG: 2-oxoglutarate dehydrogenase E1 component [Phycisphaerales bacterium]|nr:2-oxoglutarate dehydrogenase E1 component [Phycisphaerales bacterium]